MEWNRQAQKGLHSLPQGQQKKSRKKKKRKKGGGIWGSKGKAEGREARDFRKKTTRLDKPQNKLGKNQWPRERAAARGKKRDHQA